jgi:hypothetical protein
VNSKLPPRTPQSSALLAPITRGRMGTISRILMLRL